MSSFWRRSEDAEGSAGGLQAWRRAFNDFGEDQVLGMRRILLRDEASMQHRRGHNVDEKQRIASWISPHRYAI